MMSLYFPLSLMLVVNISCVDTESDYQSYVDRTNSLRGSVGNVTNSETPTIAADISGTFWATCLVSTFQGIPDSSIMFWVDVKYTPTGQGGSVDAVFKPLSVLATSFDESLVASSPLTPPSATVNAEGLFLMAFGDISIKGSANRIRNSEMKIQGTTLSGKITLKNRFCGNLSGQITQPIQLDLDNPAPGSICIFQRFNAGSPLPQAIEKGGVPVVGLPTTDYHCP